MMIKEFLQQKQELSLGKGEEEKNKKMRLWRVADRPELSLGPSRFIVAECGNSSSSESEANPCRKRKYAFDQLKTDPMIQTSIELQLKDPLPLDWEQCLDLESGRMYYLNRKTLKKSWNWPKDQKIDLELNISTLSNSDGNSATVVEDANKNYNTSSNMVAVACLKCHLLVMLCKSSPSCPNCKYLHSLPTQQSPRPKISTTKTLETLSLLN
ncbi:protein CURLY FLAG LEAF 1-like [Magnolia sinica]|uniref:protein CURLY FLAG LEAF 1-like n=1 Tax=Magnolia sinica TaxID=86752 RepID=UPI00265AFACF|nr:protein CURLY FLAG LEAF 1-like [Magnolia sinica]XP_058093999.1 protein CURLY FLAG LEAF 1-like [Magnolia sinica]